jgi:hypothetical protein
MEALSSDPHGTPPGQRFPRPATTSGVAPRPAGRCSRGRGARRLRIERRLVSDAANGTRATPAHPPTPHRGSRSAPTCWPNGSRRTCRSPACNASRSVSPPPTVGWCRRPGHAGGRGPRRRRCAPRHQRLGDSARPRLRPVLQLPGADREPGIYYLVVEGGPETGAAFQVMEPGSVAVPGPGDPMPPFDTPTFDDSRGVDPLCTREPEPCPFHEVTLTDALVAGKPVAYLVGTPAFCQTGTCAPALESMIAVQDRFGDTFTWIHAEVYTDNTATTPTDAVEAATSPSSPLCSSSGPMARCSSGSTPSGTRPNSSRCSSAPRPDVRRADSADRSAQLSSGEAGAASAGA